MRNIFYTQSIKFKINFKFINIKLVGNSVNDCDVSLTLVVTFIFFGFLYEFQILIHKMQKFN